MKCWIKHDFNGTDGESDVQIGRRTDLTKWKVKFVWQEILFKTHFVSSVFPEQDKKKVQRRKKYESFFLLLTPIT